MSILACLGVGLSFYILRVPKGTLPRLLVLAQVFGTAVYLGSGSMPDGWLLGVTVAAQAAARLAAWGMERGAWLVLGRYYLRRHRASTAR